MITIFRAQFSLANTDVSKNLYPAARSHEHICAATIGKSQHATAKGVQGAFYEGSPMTPDTIACYECVISYCFIEHNYARTIGTSQLATAKNVQVAFDERSCMTPDTFAFNEYVMN